jgi:ABC-type nitrate/sulfonate/bicarbonate transport system permease component
MIAAVRRMSPLSRRVLIIKVVTALCVIAAWEALSLSGLFYKGILPSVIEVLRACVAEIADKSFYKDLGYTLLESFVGFVGGSVVAVTIAVVLGLNPYARRVVEPYINALGGTPKIIFLPILFLIFGLGIESKMAKAALSAFFPVVVSTVSGFIQIPPVFLRVGQSFGLTRWQMVQKIYLPAMSEPLLTGLRLGIAMAIIGVLSAEISYSNAGLGYRLIQNADQFKIPSVYAITLLIFTVSATINTALTHLQHRMAKHKRGRIEVSAVGTNTALVPRSA